MTWNKIIIGTGISGLFVLKHLKERGIDKVLVLDKNPEPFGVWNIQNHPSVHDFTYCVSSKLYMTISDFPIPKHYPEFPSHADILAYYKMYAQHFDLLKHVQCKVEVCNVQKHSRGWQVETKNQKRKRYSCDHLVIACGTVNNCLNLPTDSFYENFTGLKFHADAYERYKDQLTNKKIVLVGVSDTACDLAEELKKKNNRILLSCKQGVWLQNRHFGAYGPADMLYNNLLDFLVKHVFGKSFSQYIIGRNYYTVPFWWGENGHGIPEWKTEVGYLNGYYVKSREIISMVAKGQLTPIGGITDISNTEVTYWSVDKKNNQKKKETEENVDSIIFCTGYKPFGALKNILEEKYYKYRYKHIFSYADDQLFFVGYIRPYLTSVPMLSELQSRWIAQEIIFKNTLPTNKFERWMEIQRDEEMQRKEFPVASKRLKTIVDPYDYGNMVATKIGVNLSLPYLIAHFPLELVYFYLFGTWNPHFFRLHKNGNTNEQIQVAYANIQETAENDTSIAVAFALKLVIFIFVVVVFFLFFLVWLLSLKT